MLRNIIAQKHFLWLELMKLVTFADNLSKSLKKLSTNASFSKNFKILERKFKHTKVKTKPR